MATSQDPFLGRTGYERKTNWAVFGLTIACVTIDIFWITMHFMVRNSNSFLGEYKILDEAYIYFYIKSGIGISCLLYGYMIVYIELRNGVIPFVDRYWEREERFRKRSRSKRSAFVTLLIRSTIMIVLSGYSAYFATTYKYNANTPPLLPALVGSSAVIMLYIIILSVPVIAIFLIGNGYQTHQPDRISSINVPALPGWMARAREHGTGAAASATHGRWCRWFVAP